MKVLGDRIHAEPVRIKYPGLVAIPDSVTLRQNYSLWTALQVGPGRVNKSGIATPIDIKPGDRLICQFSSHGTAHDFPDGTAILDSDHVLAVIPKL